MADVPLDPLAALRRLAVGARDLCFLDGGARAPSYLALPGPALPLGDLDAVRALRPTGGLRHGEDGWPVAVSGGGILQLDYEFPVGPNAFAALVDADPPGRYWPCDAWVYWAPGDSYGRLQGPDAAARRRLAGSLAVPPPAVGQADSEPAGLFRPAWDRSGHMRRVERIREWIAAGDIYQANLTLPFRGTAPGPEADLACFLALRRRSAAGFACLLRCPERSVISHSPECYLAADGEGIESRPIKGTRRRLPGREAAVRQELLGSAKDRAELAMIIDLVRNDLGRIAVPGSVTVPRPARILDLEYVHHLEATVRARLGPGRDLADCLAASFPAGSITGAPKIRAMQIIRQLEAGPRGPYCGTFGWLASPRRFVLAVAIRTMVLSNGHLRFDAGGGIVADSDGEAEWDEVWAKAAMMEAVAGRR